MERLLDNPAQLLARCTLGLLITLLIATFTVILVLNDPAQAHEVRWLVSDSFYTAYKKAIVNSIVLISDLMASVAWIVILQRMLFYKTLLGFDKFKERTTRIIAQLEQVS